MDAALQRCGPIADRTTWRLRHRSANTAPGPMWGTPPNQYRGPPYYLWTQGNATWADGAPVGQTIGVPGLEVAWRAADLLTCVTKADDDPVPTTE